MVTGAPFPTQAKLRPFWYPLIHATPHAPPRWVDRRRTAMSAEYLMMMVSSWEEIVQGNICTKFPIPLCREVFRKSFREFAQLVGHYSS